MQNATTIAGKFRDLFGLELALKQELRELVRAQASCWAAVGVGFCGRAAAARQQQNPAIPENQQTSN